MTDDLVLPESLQLYLSDPAVRSAIQTLVSDRSTFPTDLTYSDLPNYYRAALAAHQFGADWGIFGSGLWQASWGAAFADSPRWRILPTADVANSGWKLTIDQLWLHGDKPFFGWIAATEDGGHWLWAGLAVDAAGGVRLVVSLEGGPSDGDPFAASNSATLDLSKDQYDNWVSGPMTRLGEGPVDTSILAEACRELVKVAGAHVDTLRVRQAPSSRRGRLPR